METGYPSRSQKAAFSSQKSGKNEQRSNLLDVLSKVKTEVQDKLGCADFPMPQFVLLGKQSVGKSRLIEALAGEQFNFVSGTLGSRRPTVLEFRNVPNLNQSRWYVLDTARKQWQEQPLSQVMQIIGQAHESLGATVSSDPVYVRVESNVCVDMQVTDLPGFREFALDSQKQQLADQIEMLVTRFMEDQRNVMLCVEEAGDAANLATLTRCKRVDPTFSRTILVRNKLDKYYRDLSTDNVHSWLDGFGDLPPNLVRFSLTLPHWKDSDPPPRDFGDLRDDMDRLDTETLQNVGVSESKLQTIGFSNFSKYVEVRIERMFSQAIGPVMKKLRDLKTENEKRKNNYEDEISTTDPREITNTCRQVGMSFAHALNPILEGFVDSKAGRVTLEEELREIVFVVVSFWRQSEILGHDDFDLIPSSEFNSLEEYLDFLKNDVTISTRDLQINGGAQFTRLLQEVEIYLRFSELHAALKKRDVIQARGVSMTSLTWREVVVKLMANEAHLPMERRITYVSKRICHFFESQKEVILDFWRQLEASPLRTQYPEHWMYTSAIQRQADSFVELYQNTLASIFANPWVFLKRSSISLGGDSLDDVMLPSFEDTKDRIPQEVDNRYGVEMILCQLMAEIPEEPSRVDEAVEKVTQLVLRTYSFIRAQLADQLELFAESFFKLPMMRRLEEDMNNLELNEADKLSYADRRANLQKELSVVVDTVTSVDRCLNSLQDFLIQVEHTQKAQMYS